MSAVSDGYGGPPMARNEQLVQASSGAVFDVLADPRGYAYWVAGSKEIRDADRSWPQRGSRFDHTVKLGPLRIKDHSCVEEVQPGRFLQLRVKGRPLGSARVRIELQDVGEGTRVTMTEDPADRFSWLAKPGWRKRDTRPREPSDALREPATSVELHTTTLGSRPSVLVWLRDIARIGR